MHLCESTGNKARGTWSLIFVSVHAYTDIHSNMLTQCGLASPHLISEQREEHSQATRPLQSFWGTAFCSLFLYNSGRPRVMVSTSQHSASRNRYSINGNCQIGQATVVTTFWMFWTKVELVNSYVTLEDVPVLAVAPRALTQTLAEVALVWLPELGWPLPCSSFSILSMSVTR